MTNVVTMSGTPLLDFKDVLERVASRDDVAHVVIVVGRNDGFMEVVYDRQPINQIVMASSVLNVVALDLARETLDDD